MRNAVYGTICWLVKYEQNGETDYRNYTITGSDEEAIRHSLVMSISWRGWRIIEIEEVTNTFKYGGKGGRFT